MAGPTVLVVEDDLLLLSMTARALRDHGLTVIETETADAAFLVLNAAPGAVDVVLSDMEMPGALSGAALAFVARHVWPDIPFVLTSGRSASALEALPDGVLFLQKPYEVPRLSGLVESLVNARR